MPVAQEWYPESQCLFMVSFTRSGNSWTSKTCCVPSLKRAEAYVWLLLWWRFEGRRSMRRLGATATSTCTHAPQRPVNLWTRQGGATSEGPSIASSPLVPPAAASRQSFPGYRASVAENGRISIACNVRILNVVRIVNDFALGDPRRWLEEARLH